MRYRPDIDGLRAIAVLPVIFFHAGFDLFSGGYVGVDIFFVISGYLITSLILRDLEKGTFGLSHFYERRIRRIVPVLFFIVLVCIPPAWMLFLPHDFKQFGQSLIAVPLFSSNILFWQHSGYFETTAELKPLLHTWSLAVEEQYYIIFPLVLIALWRWGRRFIMPVFVLGLLFSLGLAQWGAYHKPVPAFYLLPTRGWELLIGALAAFFMHRTNGKTVWPHAYAQIMSLLGLSFIALAVFGLSDDTPFPSLYALLPTVGAVLIILFSIPRTVVYSILSQRIFVGIGLISYSLYLWHHSLLAFARYAHGDLSVYGTVLLCALTVPLSYASWRYIEQPFRHKYKTDRFNVFILAAGVSLVLIAFGSIIHVSNGNIGQFSNADMHIFGQTERHDDYVWQLKKAVRKKSFEETATLKLLVIGDSNSADFINALSFSRGFNSVSLSSLTINNECGNIYAKKETYTHRISKKRSSICDKADNYFGEEERRLLKQANRVVLASNWRDWEIDVLEESLRRLKDDFGDKFYVFGNKHVDFQPRTLLEMPDAQRKNATTKPVDDQAKRNERLKIIAGARFIDPYVYLCEQTSCLILTPDQTLINYDGFHFSEQGAHYIGQKIDIKNLFD